MKIAIIADCHLNKTVYKGVMDKNKLSLPFRNVDYMNAFEYMIDKNINEIKPELVVIPGDIFDTFDPNNDVRGFLNEQIAKLKEARIPIIFNW